MERLDDIAIQFRNLQDSVISLENEVSLISLRLESKSSAVETQSAPEKDLHKVVLSKKATIPKVLGFTICQKWIMSNGKRYTKWYAARNIDDKRVWIYLGNDPGKENAESKITQWLEKRNLTVDREKGVVQKQ